MLFDGFGLTLNPNQALTRILNRFFESFDALFQAVTSWWVTASMVP